MRFLTLTASALLTTLGSFAQQPNPGKADVWGHSPTARDDRFSNPKSKLYAGPDGWYNAGEVRATVANAAKTSYKYTANFQEISGNYEAVKGMQILHMEFGSTALPKPGVYKIGSKGSVALKTVHFSFTDVSNHQINEWVARDGAGTLTVSLVNGYTYFRCRNVALLDTGVYNKGEMAKPMTIGFEGALPPQ